MNISITTIAIICIILVVNFLFSLVTQTITNDNFSSTPLFYVLWISTILGIIISYFINIDVPS